MAGDKNISAQAEQTNIINRFKRLFETSQWSDCTFLISDVEFHSHKLILAMSSPVFEVMFYGPLAEKDIVNITDMGPMEFKQLLSYIYTDSVEIESVDNAWKLLYAAKKYLLTELATICLEYITNNINASNALSSYELAEMYDDLKIQENCLDVICKYTPLVLKCDYHISPSTLHLILDQNYLNAPESDLIYYTIKWVEEECICRDIPITDENKRTILLHEDILNKLRFLTLPMQCLLNKSVLNEILTSDELKLLGVLRDDPHMPVLTPVVRFSMNRKERIRVQLPCHTATRWILKGASLLRVNSANPSIKTQIFCNRKVLIQGFMVPTRLAARWITDCYNNNSEKYTESFVVSIKDLRTNTDIVPVTIVNRTASINSNLVIKLTEPAIFENGVPYQVAMTWPFECLNLNGYEYSLDCLCSYADRKGIRFELRSEFDFIQSISYSPYVL